MRILVLADVHANLAALEAVLADARERGGWEAAWIAGDWVGYGPDPERTVEVLRSLDPVAVRGDMDEEVLDPAAIQEGEHAPPAEKLAAIEWTRRALSPETSRHLASLPRRRDVSIGSHAALLVHGSPASHTEHLRPDTPDSRLEDLARIAATDLVVCGHSHQPFRREAAGTLFLNPGSVGRAPDGDPRASYAILDLGSDEAITVEHHRVPYDVEPVATAVRRAGLPEAVARMFVEGRGLGENA